MAQEALAALEELKLKFHKDEQGRITGGTMHIQHSLYPGLPKDGTRTRPLYLGETKTQKGNRYLSLPASYCYELQHYRKLHLEWRLKMGNWPNTDFVFTRLDGPPISPQILSNYFGQVRRKLGILKLLVKAPQKILAEPFVKRDDIKMFCRCVYFAN